MKNQSTYSPQRLSSASCGLGFDAFIHALGVLATTVTFFLLSSASALAAEETRVFDAPHSLTGSCQVTSTDDVPDPGLCPGVPGVDHPSKPFQTPGGVAVDAYGDVFVANLGPKNEANPQEEGFEGRVDIFDSSGRFISEIPIDIGPKSLAVDSDGNLYVGNAFGDTGEHARGECLVVFEPTVYDPALGHIEYDDQPVVVEKHNACGAFLAINLANDHLFLSGGGPGGGLTEYNSLAEARQEAEEEEKAFEGNKVVDGVQGINAGGEAGVAVDAERERLYWASWIEKPGGGFEYVIRAYDLASLHDAPEIINGSSTPAGKFQAAYPGIAVDESNGHIFRFEEDVARIYELDENGHYVATIEHSLQGTFRTGIAVDNGPESPNGGHDPYGHFLYVPSNPIGLGHVYAFAPKPPATPPAIESRSVAGITASEAVLRAKVNPNGLPSHYAFEYTTQQHYEEEANSFAGATLAREGTLPAGNAGVSLTAPLTNLSPGTPYRYRLLVSNETGSAEEEGSFTTYSPPAVFGGACANQALRTGASAGLPDCRAYELVTPSNTNGHAIFGSPRYEGAGTLFPSRGTSPAGDAVSFLVEGGGIPAMEGTGGLKGDAYLATRGARGWRTILAGPGGAEAQEVAPGAFAADQSYSFLAPSGGSLAPGGVLNSLRYPDGHLAPIGRGSLATDLKANGQLIAPGGRHVIFTSSVRLEKKAPSTGVEAVYDRTIDSESGEEETHVVSLLPGDHTPAGQNASYEGASPDGRGIAFRIGRKLYLRRDNTETFDPVPQARSGYLLSCDPGNGFDLAGATLDYEWLANSAQIAGATSATYAPDAGKAGALIQCVVHASNPEGGSISISTPLLLDRADSEAASPRPVNRPELIGEPSVGQNLQCQSGSWENSPSFSYQWLRGGTPIEGANADTYQAQAADQHKLVQCEVTAAANGFSARAVTKAVEVDPPNPPAGGLPAIENVTHPGVAPVLSDQLSCNKGSWENSPSFSYQWLRDGAAIAGETTPTHTVVAADENGALQCEVLATNADGASQAVSTAIAISPLKADEVPSGSVAVSGLPVVGATLECKPSNWQNEPDFAYRWLRNGAPIGSQTSSTYQLVAADREAVVQCELIAKAEKASVLALAGGYINRKPSPDATVAGQLPTFAGVTSGGDRLFYLQGHDLWRFDAETGQTTRFSKVGNATVVNVSEDGTAAFFVSATVLPVEPNPLGDSPISGKENLYRSDEGQISFVGTVTERDVTGENLNFFFDGLGLWVDATGKGLAAVETSRSTPDGSVLLFASRADLTGYDPQGKPEIYRYDAATSNLACVSCTPTRAPATGGAALLTMSQGWGQDTFPLSRYADVRNLAVDGNRAFFESTEALVPADADGLRDVYEWEGEGIGSCKSEGGCIYLISSGQSGQPNYLYAVSENGNDVFIETSDLLLPTEDPDETPSIYDARVEGGFPPPPARAGECLGESCQPAASPPPRPPLASSVYEGSGNVPKEASARCPRGKKAKARLRKGASCRSNRKQHSQRKHPQHRKHRDANSKRRTSR